MHPDISKEENAADTFMRMREAYKVLHKDGTRNEYDRKTFGEKKADVLRFERDNIGENNAEGDVEGETGFDKSKYKQAGKDFETEVTDLRKSIEDWENKKYGKNSYFGKNKPIHKKGPSESNINTNLDTTGYTEWHEWSFEFLSSRPKRPKIEIIEKQPERLNNKLKNPSTGTQNFTQSHYETPRSTAEANEEEWMDMREERLNADNYKEGFENDDFENELEEAQSAAIDRAMERRKMGKTGSGIEKRMKSEKWKSGKNGSHSGKQIYNKISKMKPTNFMNP